MLEKLFKKPAILARHKNAPYIQDRERYLAYCAQEGYTQKTLILIARALLWASHELSLYPEISVSREQIVADAKGWVKQQHHYGPRLNPRPSHDRLVQVATQWLRFIGRLQDPVAEPTLFAELIENFRIWMERERGLTSGTIRNRNRDIMEFLTWYGAQKRPFQVVEVSDVDSFLVACGKRLSRLSVARCAASLRAFFRYAEMRGWCRTSIAEEIQAPRVFREEGLPSGPSWENVKRLFASMETEQPFDIRDRAILMLFAIYSLRASEVSKLRLEDIDWEHDCILVRRAKRREPQVYPLVPTVGNAIARYLKEVRPKCTRREVFLTFRAPFRPFVPTSFNHLTRPRMLKLGIRSRHQGPHSLRHACASHLISEGFSIKEIGDHMGHRSSSATRIYAKVDLPRLREVAKFDLGGLL